ncbi:MAG: MAPEG family protein [Rhizobiaceae bacterium]|nr:MAPEG family protein [Rhizobiaceae bacterium]
MSVEMAYLALSVLLLLVIVSVQSFSLKAEAGNAYTVGARDQELPRGVFAGRAERALRNFLETFAGFAVVAVALEVTDKADWWSALGAALYFWGRVAHLPLYLAGIAWLRTFAWNVATLGIAIMLWRFAF